MKPYLGFFGDAFKTTKESISNKVYDLFKQLTDLKLEESSASGPKKLNIRLKIDEIENELKSIITDNKKLNTAKGSYEAINKADAHNASVLRVLGGIRQITEHSEYFHIPFSSEDQLQKNLKDRNFRIDLEIVKNNYKDRIDKINNEFMEKSSMNLHILFDLLDAKSEAQNREIAERYYKFSILKEGKNLGVNMKKIRERMINEYIPEIKEKKHDSYRSKLYIIADYLLFESLSSDTILQQWCDVLRQTASDDEKEVLYKDFAREAWNKNQKLIKAFFGAFDGRFPSYSTEKIDEKLIDHVKMKADDAGVLVQLLAFLCHFMDAKEINELLSAYIHKFECIQDFIDTLKKLGEEVNFSDKYALFNQNGGKEAGEIAKQLRVLVSIGKMKPDLDGAKRPLYQAAIKTLGVQDDSEYVTNEWLEKNVLLSQEDRKDSAKKNQANPFRNFIARNVISSRRFFYLVRYTKPKTVRAVMQNEKVVFYVLKRLSEFNDAQQINAYYQNIDELGDSDVPVAQKIERLTKKLTGFSFQNVWDKRGGIVANSKKGKDKNQNVRNLRDQKLEIERLKALVGLYLTVAFIAIKSLVKANARYYIAFAAYDRDRAMFMKKEKETIDSIEKNHSYTYIDKNGQERTGNNELFSLTEYFLDQEDKNDYKPPEGVTLTPEEFRTACRKHLDTIRRHFTKKWREHFRGQFESAIKINFTGFLMTQARNDAAHLNVLSVLPRYIGDFRKRTPGKGMLSYFELFHFLLQSRMCKEEELRKHLDISAEQRRHVEFAGIPSSDLINIAYTSLGYNLPRYKNLTCEALFDPDSEKGKELAKKRKKREDEKANRRRQK